MKYVAETIWGASIALPLVAIIVAGCAGPNAAQTGAPPSSPAASDAKANGVAAAQAPELSGADLWAQNCALCHNAPSPSAYSDAHWSVAVMHMRIQARLTGEEERKIREFLQASN